MSELYIKIFLIACGLIYLTFMYIFDCRQINDERREMIRLKSLRLTQKLTLAILIIITFTNCFVNDIPNLYILGILILSNILLEMGLKLYYENNL